MKKSGGLRRFFVTFKQKVAGIKCHENSKIDMSPEFKVANSRKEGNIRLKTHLNEQKPYNLLQHPLKKYRECKQNGSWKVKKWVVVVVL